MTRDELLSLPITRLVHLVVENRKATQELRARNAELEKALVSNPRHISNEELFNLPISQLVDYVIEYESTAQQLRSRNVELERELADAARRPEPKSDSREGAAASELTADGTKSMAAPGDGLDRGSSTGDGAAHSDKVHRHRHHHRPWYRRLQTKILPQRTPWRISFGILAVLVILAALLGIFAVEYVQHVMSFYQ